jgi:transketolase
LSDGECDEGSNWEAALLASHLKLDNLVAVIDRNKLQSLKGTEETVALEPLSEKWEAFGWYCTKINGHDFNELSDVTHPSSINSPRVYIADTIKGRGVSFMENQAIWHHGGINGDQFNEAIKELSIGLKNEN